MKTKLLFSACALASVFAACNNEELVVENTPVQNVAQEVVGADLVSNGLILDFGASRVTNGNWENGDQLALAWYNVATAVTEQQTETTWKSQLAKGGDKVVYNNNLFTFNAGNFETTANIYQGAYFVYFPFQYQAKVDQLKFSNTIVNPVQTADFEAERYNKALHISAQDFIAANAGVTSEHSLQKEFVISPVVNVLRVTATPEDAIKNSKLFSGYVIKNVTVTANTSANVFKTTNVEIVPQNIPAVVRTKTKVIDYAKTVVALDEYATTLVENANTKAISTKVENKDYTLAANRDVRVFALPVELSTYSANTYPSISVTVGKAEYDLGTFVVNKANSEEAITKLKKALSDENYKGNLSEILRDSKGKWAAMGLESNLLAANFNLKTANIKSLAQWNDVVALIDELDELNKTTAPRVLSLGANIEFDGEIKTPKNGAIIQNNGNYQIIISKNTVWPENLTGEWKESKGGFQAVVVKDGATLTVNNDNSMAKSQIDFKVEKGGVINLATKDAYIHLAGVNEGEVKIGVYGAKVEKASDDATAIISYELTGNDKAYQINNLTGQTNGLENNAYVNKLIVKDIVFDLTLTDPAGTATSDPYQGAGNAGQAVSLSGVEEYNIELNNGSIINGTKATVAKAVNSITVVNGTNNLIQDVTTDDLTINSGAKATIKTTTAAKTLSYSDILVEKDATLVADGVTVKYDDWTTTNGTTSGVNGGKFEKNN